MKRAVLAISSLLIGMGALFVFALPADASVDSSPDCDTVAIVTCGVTKANVKSKAKEGDVPKVYAAFGIQNSELDGFVDGVVWKDGRVTIGYDKVVAKGAMTAGRWNNPTGDMKRIQGTDRAYKMSTSHFVDDGQTALIKMVNGKFKFAIIKPCGNPVTATPVEPPPAPTYKCEELRKDKQGRDTFKFTAHATADNGAKIVKYRFDFGDGKKDTVTKNTIVHKYDKPGTYTVRVTAIIKVNGKQVEATSKGCVKQVVVEKPPVKPAPEYSCKFMNLHMVNKEERTVETETEHLAKQGAVFSHYLINFGDGTPAVKSTTGKVQHTYVKDGTYTVRAHVVVKVNNATKTVTDDMCAKQVTFTAVTPPTITPPTPETPTPETPTVLADTGPGALIGMAFSSVFGGMLAYRLVWLRLFV